MVIVTYSKPNVYIYKKFSKVCNKNNNKFFCLKSIAIVWTNVACLTSGKNFWLLKATAPGAGLTKQSSFGLSTNAIINLIVIPTPAQQG